MVELTLENVENDGMPAECFVSVRVGDAQKLSRLSAARVFRFPQAGDRRFGKIEVFRRIGACSVDVDPAREGLREVTVNCGDAGFGSLGLRLAVGGEAVKQKKAEEAAHSKKAGTKEKAAKDYLAQHGLEIQLSEAMQALLRERPDNPTEYLASKLLSRAGPPGGKLPPMAASSQIGRDLGTVGVEWRKPVDAQYQTSAAKKGPQKLEPLEVAPQMQVAPQPRSLLVPSQALPAVATSSPKALIPATVPQAQIPASVPVALAASAVPSWQTKPSIGTWLAHLPRSKVGSWVAPADWKFKPSVGTWLAPLLSEDPENRSKEILALQESSPPVSARGPQANYRHAPSIGTWIAPFGGVRPKVAADSGPLSELPQSKFRPSVGTWLVHVDHESSSKVLVEQAQPMLNIEGPDPAYKLAPSVGTWIAVPAQLRANTLDRNSGSGHGTVEMQMCFRPSVGTWLVPRVEETNARPPKKKLVALSTLIGPAFYSFGLRPNFRVI